jgi:hypothetical protein
MLNEMFLSPNNLEKKTACTKSDDGVVVPILLWQN